MRIHVAEAGRSVEIQTDEPDMTAEKLADLAVRTLARTDRETETWGASGCSMERRGQRIGFTWNLGENSQLDVH